MGKLNAKMLLALRGYEGIELLLLFSKTEKEFTFNEIQKRLKKRGEYFRKNLNDLCKAGWLERIDEKRPHKYRIAAQHKISKRLFQANHSKVREDQKLGDF